MKTRILKLLVLTGVLTMSACYKVRMIKCFLAPYPKVLLTGFDTLEIDSIKISKYNAQFGFDSLISSKMISIHDAFFYQKKDSFNLRPFLHSYPQVDYDGSSRYNFMIRFGNNRDINLYDFLYTKHECESDGSGPGQSCSCEYLGCKVSTTNCTNTTISRAIYISP